MGKKADDGLSTGDASMIMHRSLTIAHAQKVAGEALLAVAATHTKGVAK